jgi:hypothetical protein
MTPAVIVYQARADGVELALTPTGTIKAKGSVDTVNRWLPLIRDNKPGILDFLKVASDPAAERRRQKVLAMLNAGPNVRYAVAVTDPDSDPVLVAVGIRNTATFELEIPLACYDPCTLLELIEKHSLQMPVNPDTSMASNGEIRT